MKVCFLCYNYLTLAKAIYYIKNVYFSDECSIVYRESISRFPEIEGNDLNVTIIKWKSTCHSTEKRWIFRKLEDLFTTIRLNLFSRRVITAVIDNIIAEKKNLIVVFKDSDPSEATLLDIIEKRYRSCCEVLMIEEGLAVYTEEISTAFTYKYGIRILNKLMGISNYGLQKRPHGLHPAINTVACTAPERLRLLRPDMKAAIVKQQNIFTSEFSQYFCDLILNEQASILTRYNNCHIVFLTQPLIGFYGLTQEVYLKAVSDILLVLSETSPVLIKPHPRDSVDYSNFLSKRVILCDSNISILPFEALFVMLGKPLLVTFSSTAAICAGRNRPSIFAYKILHNLPMENSINVICNERTDIISVQNVDELRQAVSDL